LSVFHFVNSHFNQIFPVFSGVLTNSSMGIWRPLSLSCLHWGFAPKNPGRINSLRLEQLIRPGCTAVVLAMGVLFCLLLSPATNRHFVFTRSVVAWQSSSFCLCKVQQKKEKPQRAVLIGYGYSFRRLHPRGLPLPVFIIPN